jgi:hypothetical protein
MFSSLPLSLLNLNTSYLIKYSDVSKNQSNNTFIQAIYVCDVLYIVTSVMTHCKDPSYD